MGLLFCYSVFGRKGKAGKSVADIGTKNVLRSVKKANPESPSTPVSVQELALFNDLFLKDQVVSEKGGSSPERSSAPEYIVDIEKLSSYQESQKMSETDQAKFCPETSMWLMGNQGTAQCGVPLSVGDGTVGSDSHQQIPQTVGTFSGFGYLHRFEDRYYDQSHGQDMSPKVLDVGKGEEGFPDSIHLPDPQACDDEERYSGHASDPGFYSRDSKLSSTAAAMDDGSVSPSVDAKKCGSVDGNLSGELVMDVGNGEGSHDSVHLSDPQACDDEEQYSGHASDPGFYSRDLKMSPNAAMDGGSVSPSVGAKKCDFVDVDLSIEGAKKCDSVDVDLSGEQSHQAVEETLQESYVDEGGGSHDNDSTYHRVKEWINSIHASDMEYVIEDELDGSGKGYPEFIQLDSGEALAPSQLADVSNVSNVVANPAVRALHPSSTVAQLSGIGLHEVPSLGVFSLLRTLNLSANSIVHVPAGCLPRSLHILDLSRNKIAQIEGFRELTRLRVLNLSFNRISRIGHGLANSTLIKELYLAGNKIAEVEGLHRLLKLAVLDLSYNKVTTSKALGQLAANYGSLLALNLLGNPILTNFSEDQIRKLVTALTPNVTYLNRHPIKAVSVREAALDNVARAALGTSQRHAKSSKTGRTTPAVSTSTVKKKPPTHHHTRHSDKKGASGSSSGRNHHSKSREKTRGSGHTHLQGRSQGYNKNSESEKWPMHRSKSAGVLNE
ncbi:hypothetical protein KP509_32G070800 [Ceratopteris richardii]|uniref:Uncharacterized protein n=2 Tax=Ceratopteris richardii TaxID=49495 RepID=A0A8T2QWC1_CERRI|nr:hypothetical protein KP509_32G070800 [Ceratopteris richardii]KAH7287726.1 hypothetical protein KP509_32G070800 [Ceratopteris richardii]KAH7287731.1 hypothetical protein KP509_32G070800 [Ceratopteris richardii]